MEATSKSSNSLACELQWDCLMPVTKLVFEKDPDKLEKFIKDLTIDDITVLAEARNEVAVIEALNDILDRLLGKKLPANLLSSLTGIKGFPNYIISRRSFPI